MHSNMKSTLYYWISLFNSIVIILKMCDLYQYILNLYKGF